MNIEMHFVDYLYIMDQITVSISVKQTHMHVSSTYVNVFVMRLWVYNSIQVKIKVSMNISCFPQYAG